MAGTKIMLNSASCQFTKNRIIGIAEDAHHHVQRADHPHVHEARMASTSAVARDHQVAGVLLVGGRAKLTFWSLSYRRFLQSKATF